MPTRPCTHTYLTSVPAPRQAEYRQATRTTCLRYGGVPDAVQRCVRHASHHASSLRAHACRPELLAEKALATIRSVELRASDPSKADPEPAAKALLIKQLPVTTDDGFLYDLFRPYGPIARAECIFTNSQGQYTGFRGVANVVYYAEEDSKKAQDELNCSELEGKLISVRPDPSPRHSSDVRGISAQATPFVPGARLNAQAPAFSPVLPSSIYSYTATPEQMDSTKGPIWAVPGTNLQYSSSASTYIDPCNLFCKNLCPSIDSSDLYEIFKPYGRIVSARVMREGGKSREFGFVSFTNAEDAARALHAVNGQHIGSKVIMVRLHEPKKVRQEKLWRLFGGEGSGSEPRSPASPPNGVHSPLQKDHFFRQNDVKNTSTKAFDEVELAGMEANDRNDVVLSEFIKRAQAMPEFGDNDEKVKALVLDLSQLNLADQVKVLNDSAEFARTVKRIQGEGASPATRAASDLDEAPTTTSRAANAEMKSAQLAVPQVQRSNSASDSVSVTSAVGPTSSKERARLLQAVTRVMPTGSPVEDITDLLAGLPKKERAMALFNPDFLRNKVDEAKEILDITADEGEDMVGEPASVEAVRDVPVVKTDETSLDMSQDGAKAKATDGKTSHTLFTLARLPCEEILRLAEKAKVDKSSPGLPLPKINERQWKETEAMMDRILEEKREAERKQKLGEVLFKQIKSLGVKGAPKVTIRLLDSEDLRSLAHVMNSYPDLLREKVTAIQAAEKAK